MPILASAAKRRWASKFLTLQLTPSPHQEKYSLQKEKNMISQYQRNTYGTSAGWRPLLMKRWRTFLCQLHQHLGAFYQDTGTISIVYNFCQNIFIKIPTFCITCRHCLLGNERYIIWHCHLNIYKVVCNSELFVEMSWKTVLTFQTWCMDIMICHYCLLYTS